MIFSLLGVKGYAGFLFISVNINESETFSEKWFFGQKKGLPFTPFRRFSFRVCENVLQKLDSLMNDFGNMGYEISKLSS
jgi:hypothetical protein